MCSQFTKLVLVCVWLDLFASQGLIARPTVQRRVGLGRGIHPHALAISPDGKLLAVACGPFFSAGEIRIFTLHQVRLLAILRGQREEIYTLAFTPDSKRLLSGGPERKCLIWSMDDYKKVGTLAGNRGMGMTISVSPDGKHVATGHRGNAIAVWDLGRQTLITTLKGHIDGARWLSFLPDGNQLIVASNNRSLRVSTMKSGKATVLATKPHKDIINALAIKPDGTEVATCGDDGSVKVWEMRTGLGIATLRKSSGDNRQSDATDEPLSLSFTRDGMRLAVGYRSGRIVMYDTTVPEFSTLVTIKGHRSDVNAIAFSPDGKTLVSASCYDQSVLLWNLGHK